MIEAIVPVEVKVKEDYRIWLRYSDGASGEVDLNYMVGRGVFRAGTHRASLRPPELPNTGS